MIKEAVKPAVAVRPDSNTLRTASNELLPTLSQQQMHSDEIGLDRMSSPNSLNAIVAANNRANSGELSSLRTTDSFPRVFKEFDFLEAEHDSISESTESCFNWLSTLRTPRQVKSNYANSKVGWPTEERL